MKAAILLAIACCLVLATVGTAAGANSQQLNAQLIVEVLDVNTAENTANVHIFLEFNSFPYNYDNISASISGIGQVTCINTAKAGDGSWYYVGELNSTCFLSGKGENYPFDSYKLHFSVAHVLCEKSVNCSLDPSDGIAYFSGMKILQLRNQWEENQSSYYPHYLPTSWHSVKLNDNNDTTEEMVVTLQRTDNTFNIAFLEFVAPIIGCYYLLIATLLLDPKKHLNERLAIYIALFVFIPAFSISIQSFLPYRNSLSFPELLLANLVLDTAILGFFSIVAHQKDWVKVNTNRLKLFSNLHSNYWDLVGLLACIISFLFIYSSTLFENIAPEASFFISYLVIPAYLVWYPFEHIHKISLKTSKRVIYSFTFGILIATLGFTIMAWLPAEKLVFTFTALLTGLSIGLYLRKAVNGSVISLISVIIGTILSGIIIGLFLGPKAFGLSGIDAGFKGAAYQAVNGYPAGIFAICSCLMVSILLETFFSKK